MSCESYLWKSEPQLNRGDLKSGASSIPCGNGVATDASSRLTEHAGGSIG
jgi:hypothetical protein